jgi:hypothetical protein
MLLLNLGFADKIFRARSTSSRTMLAVCPARVGSECTAACYDTEMFVQFLIFSKYLVSGPIPLARLRRLRSGRQPLLSTVPLPSLQLCYVFATLNIRRKCYAGNDQVASLVSRHDYWCCKSAHVGSSPRVGCMQ